MVAGEFYPCPFTDKDFFVRVMSQAEMRSIFANVRRKGTTNLFVGTYSEDMMEMATFPFGEYRNSEQIFCERWESL